MNISERENIEWTNSWLSDANKEVRRCLLVGDSTTRQIRKGMEELLKNIFSVDLFASSCSVFDKRLLESLKAFFLGDEYKYDVIVLHYGGHHGFSRLCVKNKEYCCLYAEYYNDLAQYLRNKCRKLLIMTGTSETMDDDTGKIDEDREKEIIKRNEIAMTVGKRLQCRVFDLYQLMKQNNNIYQYSDRQHFMRDSDYFIGYHICQFMMKEGIMDKDCAMTVIHKNRDYIEKLLGIGKKYLIYGAGVSGKELYWILKWNGLEKNIKYYVISHREASGELFGIPIIPISELSKTERQQDILIVSSEKYEMEMKHTALEMEFKHIRLMNEIKMCLE